VQVSELFHNEGVYAGKDETYLFGSVRASGPDPEHRSYRSFASFKDPDGKGSGYSRKSHHGCPTALTPRPQSLRRQAIWRTRCGALRPRTARTRSVSAADPNWPDWYAKYTVAEQARTELPK
jgi:hypothetical protein